MSILINTIDLEQIMVMTKTCEFVQKGSVPTLLSAQYMWIACKACVLTMLRSQLLPCARTCTINFQARVRASLGMQNSCSITFEYSYTGCTNNQILTYTKCSIRVFIKCLCATCSCVEFENEIICQLARHHIFNRHS